MSARPLAALVPRAVGRLLSFVVVAVTAGCFSPSYTDGQFSCGPPENACPAGLRCLGGQCVTSSGDGGLLPDRPVDLGGDRADPAADGRDQPVDQPPRDVIVPDLLAQDTRAPDACPAPSCPPLSCGLLVDACGQGINCGACPDNFVCGASAENVCDCMGTLCTDECVDTDTNPQHCGQCDHPCGPALVCSLGDCVAGCADGLTACAGSCVDLTRDPGFCGECTIACGALETCADSSCRPAPVASCAELLGLDPSLGSGVYTLYVGGDPGAPYQTTCEMTINGGGWTMLLKLDGNDPASQFFYSSTQWTDATPLNPDSPDLDPVEAKLASFAAVPFDQLLLGTSTASGEVRSLVVDLSAPSLLDAMLAGPIGLGAGRDAWLSLFPGGGLQDECNLEGTNLSFGFDYARVRIGIVGNQEPDCFTPDSYAGFGGEIGPCNGCYADCFDGFSVGAVGGGPGCQGAADASVFGYVFAR